MDIKFLFYGPSHILLPVTIYHLPLLHTMVVQVQALSFHWVFKVFSTWAYKSKSRHKKPRFFILSPNLFVKVTHSLSELHRTPFRLSLSSAKRTSLYHGSSVFVLDSLPAGNLRLSCSLCGLLFDWVMYFHESCGQISKLTHYILSFWHLHLSI